ncbi:MAG: hypothetical protein SVY10_00635 [Thermodesulfobacteriota bacterium]|nr:hypothetical protein [Thermodesulfobacteriota bacterium]
MKKYLLTFVLLFAFALFGCDENIFESFSDDDTKQAKLEEARIALDDEDYEKALALLEDLDQCDPDVATYLSSAYMGMANFNALDLVTNAEELADDDDAGSIELISSVLDEDGDGQITLTEITNGIQEAVNAIDAVTRLSGSCSESLTCDEEIILGVAGALHATYMVLQLIQEDLGVSPIPVTEEGINAAYETHDFDTGVVSDEELLALNTSMGYMSNAIDCMTKDDKDNELAENFEEFQQEIGYGDGQIDRNDLANYIDSIGD